MAVDVNKYKDQAANAPSAGINAGGSGVSASEPSVFWGSRPVGSTRDHPVATKMGGSSKFNTDDHRATPGGVGGFAPTPGVDNSTHKSLSEAQGEFYRWSDSERNKWGDYLLSLGLIDEGDERNYVALKGAWDDVIGEAANFTAAGKRITPWQVAALVAGGSAQGGGKAKGFTGSKSQTSLSVDLTDPETAKALVNNVLSKQLGRAATPEEMESFRNSLSAAERANPTSTTSTTQYANGDATAQSSTTTGGLSGAGKEQVLQDQAMLKPEYGAYQAATTYFQALASAMGSPV